MTNSDLQLLRSPVTVRERANQLYQRALDNHSPFFKLNLDQMENCCQFVLNLANEHYDNFNVPFHSRWRHFEMDGINRIAKLKSLDSFSNDRDMQGRTYFELIILSVLLDAGAGTNWHYHESSTGFKYSRSEGLAVASLDMYRAGLFSCSQSLTADKEALKDFNQTKLAQGMQVSEANPLLGLAGRSQLVQSLADVIDAQPDVFTNQRLGDLYVYVLTQAKYNEETIDASKVLSIVLQVFSTIWPKRISIDGENLGDVWHHDAISGPGKTNKLIPFHKLSQWLTYSLLEPLQWAGYKLVNLEQLTGLAEYRNGGLFIDTNVIELKDTTLSQQPLAASSAMIVEWRALTISLLDRLWHQALQYTAQNKASLPLVAFLEAGTWKAGRIIAKQLRSDGRPPINIISDGTVF